MLLLLLLKLLLRILKLKFGQNIEAEVLKSFLSSIFVQNCKSLPFFYFLTFEKGRLPYIHPVGWSVAVTLNFFNIYTGIKALY